MSTARALRTLRLRTPRLELRLGSEDEVRELGVLAQEGIHPPEEMPFAVAWTDGAGKPGFLADFELFHRTQLESWAPEDWSLQLLVWEGSQLAGTQGISAHAFAEQREVATGSWLGAAFQGRGLGTEMRTAVLELAFVGLGARRATSGWLEGNRASARVSEKLGYRITGSHEISPRDAPVVHHDVVLTPAEWRPPVAVTIAGLEPLLPLFGAQPPSERSAAASD